MLLDWAHCRVLVRRNDEMRTATSYSEASRIYKMPGSIVRRLFVIVVLFQVFVFLLKLRWVSN